MKKKDIAATYLLARHSGLYKPYFPRSFYNEDRGASPPPPPAPAGNSITFDTIAHTAKVNGVDTDIYTLLGDDVEVHAFYNEVGYWPEWGATANGYSSGIAGSGGFSAIAFIGAAKTTILAGATVIYKIWVESGQTDYFYVLDSSGTIGVQSTMNDLGALNLNIRGGSGGASNLAGAGSTVTGAIDKRGVTFNPPTLVQAASKGFDPIGGAPGYSGTPPVVCTFLDTGRSCVQSITIGPPMTTAQLKAATA